MEPIKFKEQNTIFAENQPEYLPLPAHLTKDGQVVSCWRLSHKERIRILFSGKLWLSLYTFNNPLQPIFPAVNKYEIFVKPKFTLMQRLNTLLIILFGNPYTALVLLVIASILCFIFGMPTGANFEKWTEGQMMAFYFEVAAAGQIIIYFIYAVINEFLGKNKSNGQK